MFSGDLLLRETETKHIEVEHIRTYCTGYNTMKSRHGKSNLHKLNEFGRIFFINTY